MSWVYGKCPHCGYTVFPGHVCGRHGGSFFPNWAPANPTWPPETTAPNTSGCQPVPTLTENDVRRIIREELLKMVNGAGQ